MLMYRGSPLSDLNNPAVYWAKMGPIYGTLAIITVGGISIVLQYIQGKKREEQLTDVIRLMMTNQQFNQYP